MNETLRRIYKILPAIGAWARVGSQNVLWGNLDSAKDGIAEYVGPRASQLVLNSLHIYDADRFFIVSTEALEAIMLVVEAIYTSRPLVDGLLPEEPGARV